VTVGMLVWAEIIGILSKEALCEGLPVLEYPFRVLVWPVKCERALLLCALMIDCSWLT